MAATQLRPQPLHSSAGFHLHLPKRKPRCDVLPKFPAATGRQRPAPHLLAYSPRGPRHAPHDNRPPPEGSGAQEMGTNTTATMGRYGTHTMATTFLPLKSLEKCPRTSLPRLHAHPTHARRACGCAADVGTPPPSRGNLRAHNSPASSQACMPALICAI